jgi:crotonobetainyl-CoA:carnitine CoA-transferase CaiB-like acyl-CoA transferase
VVENWRPDVKHRLGIDYESLRKVNPRIVYASISGFGQDGPYRSRPGLDQVAQGLGGIMSVNGKPESGPVRVGIPIADLTAGHFMAQGILIALLEREVSGEGQWVYTSLLEAQIAMMDFQAARWLMRGEVPKQVGNAHPIAAAVELFPTADGELNIQASGDPLFKRLCVTLGAPEMVDDPDYVDRHKRLENRDALDGKIAELTRKFTTAELIDKLNEAGVPCGPVYAMDQVFADPQVKHLAMEPTVDHPKLGTYKVVGQPLHMSRTPQHMRNATPELGEHTEAVLAEIGYDVDAVAGLRERKVI